MNRPALGRCVPETTVLNHVTRPCHSSVDNAALFSDIGFGVHRCMGNHVAEMQLRILWEKILAKFPRIEVVGEVERLTSNYVSGIEKMPVRIPT